MAKRATKKPRRVASSVTAQLSSSPLVEVKQTASGKKRLAMPQSYARELYHRPEISGWTPEKIESALTAADSGSYRRLADLCETMFPDDRVTGVMSTRTHGLMGLPVDFKRGTKEARALMGTQEDGSDGEWWSMHDESEAAKLLRWGLFLGVGLAQRIPQPRTVGQPHTYKLRTWSPRWLTYYYQPVNGSHWHVLTQDNGLVPIVAGDGEWILFTPYGERRPHSEALWRSVYFPWLLKRFALEDRANYSEVLGSPIRTATTGPGATEKQRTRLVSQLRNLGKNAAIVLPDGWEMKLLEATGRSYEVYQTSVAWADAAITVAIAGQLVTTEGTTGFGSGNIHDDIKQDLIRFDAKRFATCLYEQSLKPWALYNYGTASAAPRPAWDTKKPTDQKDNADGLSKLGDAITKINTALASYGLRIDAKKLAADFDVPLVSIGGAGGQV